MLVVAGLFIISSVYSAINGYGDLVSAVLGCNAILFLIFASIFQRLSKLEKKILIDRLNRLALCQ